MKEQQPTAAAPAPAPDNDKSRNLTGGYNMLAAAFPIINFIMFFLAWFTVPIEVLFRRNFGQRLGIPLKLTRRSGAIWQCVPLIFDQGVPGGLTRYSGAN